MEPFYLMLVVFLFILAIFDLMVGVSNDAVNFLNSAIGAKAASFRVILAVASVGIFVGASFSNGMMDVARHGIFQPQNFYLTEIMCILLAVMFTDVLLLDVFNSLGLPTSTTVSLVFNLLGATFAIGMLKIFNAPELYTFGDLLNTDKAFSVIIAIFVSVAIAFFFGTIVQYISRLIFTFNYKKSIRYFGSLYAGVACTAIIYFIIFKGLKETSFMNNEMKAFLDANTTILMAGIFVALTIFMQILQWMKVNTLKIIVLLGTFALALAFAGNDLVNFIGVPLAGYSSYIDYVANGAGVAPDQFFMTSLLGPAKTPWPFLVGSGAIMIIALLTSKKAHNVIKTSLDLSRQDEGEETFGTSPIARLVVRVSSNISSSMISIMPMKMRQWIDSRFQKDEMVMEEGASFDLIRASVNLVLASLLIALGTSFKLPLSTTYVTFMVAMGSSLADRAWGRESAVYRITGVLSVIGGWFITAAAAFFISFVIALIIHFGDIVAIVTLMALTIFILIRSQMAFKKKMAKMKETPSVQRLFSSQDSVEIMNLLRQNTREEISNILETTAETFDKTITSFMNESFRGLRKAMNTIQDEKRTLKQMKRLGTLGVARLDSSTLLDKGLYYYQGNDFISEVIYSLGRICEPCLEHTDNNFNPLQETQKTEFTTISKQVINFLSLCRDAIARNDYSQSENIVNNANTIINHLALLKRTELKRIQSQTGSLKVNLVYLTMVQETQNMVAYASNLLKVSKKFQVEN